MILAKFDPEMRTQYDRALATLEEFLSPATARALLARSMKEHGIAPSQLTAADLTRMHMDLRRGVRLFVDGSRRDAAEQGVSRMCGGSEELPQAISIEINDERDVGRVRAEARRICTSCGGAGFSMQKVATVVSELARNIVLYAGEGEVSITPKRSTNGSALLGKTTIVVLAKDSGPGIPDIEHVLSGKYRSKTGLGKGLLGTRRLAERFDVASSSKGTTITAEIVL